MSASLTLLLSFFCTISAAPMSWIGTWRNGMGNTSICVSLVNGMYYGQASFSTLGYMRGTIDPSTDQWAGNFYLMGHAVIKGTFTLNLTSATTYSGLLLQDPGFPMTASGALLSSATPTDLECLKTDDDYLTVHHSWNGNYQSSTGGSKSSLRGSGSDFVASYYYTWSDGTVAQGHMEGTNFENNQVSVQSWYEAKGVRGLEIMVAKNADQFHGMWWWIDSVAYCDLSLVDNPDMYGVSSNSKISNDYDTADDNFCLIHQSAEEESSCWESASSDDDEDTDVEQLLIITEAVLAVSVLSFAATIAVCIAVMKGKQPPMSSSSSSADRNFEMK